MNQSSKNKPLSNAHRAKVNWSQPMVYQIRLAGRLGNEWADWFEGLAVTLVGDGDTLLTGEADQAALHGLLKKVRDLGLTLISVNPVEESRQKD
jgi:hypothetical protein